METIATDSVSGLKIYWRKLGLLKDGGAARKELLTALGHPSRVTLTKWLTDPGKMKVSDFHAALSCLQRYYPEITQQDLLKIH